MTWSRCVVVGVLVVGVGAAGCSSDDPAPDSSPTSSPSPRVSESPEPSEPSPTAMAMEDRVMEVWEAFMVERLDQLGREQEPDPAGFEGLAVDPEAEADEVATERSAGLLETTETEFWPQVSQASATEWEVADCVLSAQRPASNPEAEAVVESQVWRATVVVVAGDTLLVDDAEFGQSDCVPPQLNEELLQAYADYHGAVNAAWDPPDPDHPLLEQTMTGERLEGLRDLLAQDRENGWAFRDPHDPFEHAVVFELGIGTATVSDCHPAHPDYGVYDVETGDRVDDEIPAVEEGQVNVTSTNLVREAPGIWKIVGASGGDNSNCNPGGTDYVVAP